MYKRALFGTAMLAATGLCLTLGGGTAHAELAGDNGLILYAQNDQNNNCVETNGSQVSQSTVATTDSTGTSTPVTAATTQDCITAATISAPDTNNNNTIVYATDGSAEQTEVANLNKVTVDQQGNPVTTPTTNFYSVPTTSGSGSGPFDFFTSTSNDPSIDKLSYSPDGTNVVATQSNAVTTTTNFCFIFLFPGCSFSSTTTTDAVVKVDVNSGTASTLYQYVAPGTYLPSSEANIAAGYAQNGVIYFSAPSDPSNNVAPLSTGFTEVQRNSDIWYIPANGQASDVKRLTNTPLLNEYFLAAAPDSSMLLVCDASSAGPNYYFVNTLDGSESLLSMRAAGYYPIGFSPDGTMLYGDLNQGSMFNPCNHYLSLLADATAFSSLNASDPRSVNVLTGVVSWAPKSTTQLVSTTLTPGKGVSSSQVAGTNVLQNTGNGSWTSLAVGLASTSGAGVTLAERRKRREQ